MRRRCLICFWSFCLAWLTLCGVANAATLTLAWNPNPEPDIAGYVLYWGTQSGVYTSNSNVGNVTMKQVTGLADATVYYFAVKAYNTAGLMSGYSSEVSGQTSGGGPPVNCTNTPAAPGCVTGTDFNGDSQLRSDLAERLDVASGGLVYGRLARDRFPGLDLAVASGRSRLADRRRARLQRRRQARPRSGRTKSRREVVVWYMGGRKGTDSSVGTGWRQDVAGWSVVGPRDFNGDGKPDLVWQNDGTWQVVVWYMGGPQGNSFLGGERAGVHGCCRLERRRHR